MAADPRSRLSLEAYRSNVDSPYPYRPSSPGDYSTPTSATFSTAQSSPRWPSGLASPTSSHSRSQSLYSVGSRTPGRRLSVPSGANPFQPTHLSASGRSSFGPGLLNSSHPAALPHAGGGAVTSPATSASAWSGRRDSNASAADDAWRRRTWHPDSRTFNSQAHLQLTAVGGQSMRPNPPPPIANPPSAQSSLRLPGIESFDPVPRRNPSPMAMDSDAPARRPVYQPVEPMQSDERRNLNMYDASLQRGLTRLDIGRKTPPRDSAGTWASEVNKAVQAQAERVRQNPTVRFEDQRPPSHAGPAAGVSARSLHQQTMSAPSVSAPKRHGWYHGPPASRGVHGPPQPPQDPRVAHVERMVHPNLTGFNGFPAANLRRSNSRTAPRMPSRSGAWRPWSPSQPARGRLPQPIRQTAPLLSTPFSSCFVASALPSMKVALFDESHEFPYVYLVGGSVATASSSPLGVVSQVSLFGPDDWTPPDAP